MPIIKNTIITLNKISKRRLICFIIKIDNRLL